MLLGKWVVLAIQLFLFCSTIWLWLGIKLNRIEGANFAWINMQKNICHPRSPLPFLSSFQLHIPRHANTLFLTHFCKCKVTRGLKKSFQIKIVPLMKLNIAKLNVFLAEFDLSWAYDFFFTRVRYWIFTGNYKKKNRTLFGGKSTLIIAKKKVRFFGQKCEKSKQFSYFKFQQRKHWWLYLIYPYWLFFYLRSTPEWPSEGF